MSGNALKGFDVHIGNRRRDERMPQNVGRCSIKADGLVDTLPSPQKFTLGDGPFSAKDEAFFRFKGHQCLGQRVGKRDVANVRLAFRGSDNGQVSAKTDGALNENQPVPPVNILPPKLRPACFFKRPSLKQKGHSVLFLRVHGQPNGILTGHGVQNANGYALAAVFPQPVRPQRNLHLGFFARQQRG